VSVRGFSLFPKPPARITVFMTPISLPRLYKMLLARVQAHAPKMILFHGL
jgi:hypothetical protein